MLHFGPILRAVPSRTFTCLDFCGDHLIAGTSVGSIYFFTLDIDGTAGLLRQIAPPAGNKRLQASISAMKVSPCLRYLAVGTSAGSVVVFAVNLYGGQMIDILHNHEEHDGSIVQSLTWRSDSHRVYSGSSEGVVIEMTCTSISNSASSQHQSAASANWMSQIFATKTTKVICRCAKAVHQLSCSVVDNTASVIDLLVVCSGSHSFLFRLPRTTLDTAPVMREISDVKIQPGTQEQGSSFTQPVDITAGACFSSTIFTDSMGKSRKLAHSILVSREATSSAARVSINHVNGEELYQFDLTDVEGATNVLPYPRSFRQLIELDHNSYKSLVLGISDKQDLYIINLQNSTLERIKLFNGNVKAVATSKCRVLVMTNESPESTQTVIHLCQVFTMVTVDRPIRIFSRTLYASIANFQQIFRSRRKQSQGKLGDSSTRAVLPKADTAKEILEHRTVAPSASSSLGTNVIARGEELMDPFVQALRGGGGHGGGDGGGRDGEEGDRGEGNRKATMLVEETIVQEYEEDINIEKESKTSESAEAKNATAYIENDSGLSSIGGQIIISAERGGDNNDNCKGSRDDTTSVGSDDVKRNDKNARMDEIGEVDEEEEGKEEKLDAKDLYSVFPEQDVSGQSSPLVVEEGEEDERDILISIPDEGNAFGESRESYIRSPVNFESTDPVLSSEAALSRGSDATVARDGYRSSSPRTTSPTKGTEEATCTEEATDIEEIEIGSNERWLQQWAFAVPIFDQKQFIEDEDAFNRACTVALRSVRSDGYEKSKDSTIDATQVDLTAMTQVKARLILSRLERADISLKSPSNSNSHDAPGSTKQSDDFRPVSVSRQLSGERRRSSARRLSNNAGDLKEDEKRLSFVQNFNRNSRDLETTCQIRRVSKIPTVKSLDVIGLCRSTKSKDLKLNSLPPDNNTGSSSSSDSRSANEEVGMKAQPSSNTFEVELDASRGLGLGLILGTNNMLHVSAFNRLADGNIGPAEASGFIELGDSLIEIDDVKLWEIGAQEPDQVMDRLMQATSIAKEQNRSVLLKFAYKDENLQYTEEEMGFIRQQSELNRIVSIEGTVIHNIDENANDNDSDDDDVVIKSIFYSSTGVDPRNSKGKPISDFDIDIILPNFENYLIRQQHEYFLELFKHPKSHSCLYCMKLINGVAVETAVGHTPPSKGSMPLSDMLWSQQRLLDQSTRPSYFCSMKFSRLLHPYLDDGFFYRALREQGVKSAMKGFRQLIREFGSRSRIRDQGKNLKQDVEEEEENEIEEEERNEIEEEERNDIDEEKENEIEDEEDQNDAAPTISSSNDNVIEEDQKSTNLSASTVHKVSEPSPKPAALTPLAPSPKPRVASSSSTPSSVPPKVLMPSAPTSASSITVKPLVPSIGDKKDAKKYDPLWREKVPSLPQLTSHLFTYQYEQRTKSSSEGPWKFRTKDLAVDVKPDVLSTVVSYVSRDAADEVFVLKAPNRKARGGSSKKLGGRRQSSGSSRSSELAYMSALDDTDLSSLLASDDRQRSHSDDSASVSSSASSGDFSIFDEFEEEREEGEEEEYIDTPCRNIKWVPAIGLEKTESCAGLFDAHITSGHIPDIDDLCQSFTQQIQDMVHGRCTSSSATTSTTAQKSPRTTDITVNDFLAKAYYGDDGDGASSRRLSKGTPPPKALSSVPSDQPTMLCKNLVFVATRVSIWPEQLASVLESWLKIFHPSSVPLSLSQKIDTSYWLVVSDLSTLYLVLRLNSNRVIPFYNSYVNDGKSNINGGDNNGDNNYNTSDDGSILLNSSSSSSSTSDWPSLKEFKSLDLGLDMSILKASKSGNSDNDAWVSNEFTAFAQMYGRYLNLDIVVAVCAAQGETRQIQRPYLWEGIRILVAFACEEEEHWNALSSAIENLLKNRLSPLSMLSSSQFFDFLRDAIETAGTGKKPSLSGSSKNKRLSKDFAEDNVDSSLTRSRSHTKQPHKSSVMICAVLKYISSILDREARLGIEILADLFSAGLKGWLCRAILVLGSPSDGEEYTLSHLHSQMTAECEEDEYYYRFPWYQHIRGADPHDPGCDKVFSFYQSYLSSLITKEEVRLSDEEERGVLNESLYLSLLVSADNKLVHRKVISQLCPVDKIFSKLVNLNRCEVVYSSPSKNLKNTSHISTALTICLSAGYHYGILLICTDAMSKLPTYADDDGGTVCCMEEALKVGLYFSLNSILSNDDNSNNSIANMGSTFALQVRVLFFLELVSQSYECYLYENRLLSLSLSRESSSDEGTLDGSIDVAPSFSPLSITNELSSSSSSSFSSLLAMQYSKIGQLLDAMIQRNLSSSNVVVAPIESTGVTSETDKAIPGFSGDLSIQSKISNLAESCISAVGTKHALQILLKCPVILKNLDRTFLLTELVGYHT